MTADTTFREFVEETGTSFYLLEFGSPHYRNLVEEFNKAKLDLEAKAEDREREEWRARFALPSTPKQQAESVT